MIYHPDSDNKLDHHFPNIEIKVWTTFSLIKIITGIITSPRLKLIVQHTNIKSNVNAAFTGYLFN